MRKMETAYTARAEYSVTLRAAVSEISVNEHIPDAISITGTRMQKNVYDERRADLYVFSWILPPGAIYAAAVLSRQYAAKTPQIHAKYGKLPIFFKKSGQYRRFSATVRQNGRTRYTAKIFLSRLSLTLFSRLRHSFHHSTQARSDGSRFAASLSSRTPATTHTAASISVNCI